jgi:hypothetical protein
MPSTTELINYLKIQADGWNRNGEKGLLEVLNQAQDLLYLQDMAQTIAYRSDGDLPYISTTDGTYEYTLNQATTGLSDDIWRVGSVLVKPPFSNQLLAAIRVEYGITPNLRQPVQQMEFNGVEYYKFYQVKTKDALRSGHPSLKFTTNVGSTTQEFYILAYKKPQKLISEQIRPSIPEHLHISCLLPAAMKLVEGYQNGNFIEALQYIDKEIKPMVQSEMNDGEQGEEHSITRFEE